MFSHFLAKPFGIHGIHPVCTLVYSFFAAIYKFILLTYIYIFMCIYTYMYVCMYVCMYEKDCKKIFKNHEMRGGKCWFAIESKTFEVSLEEVRGKLRGTIVERSRGFSSWIKFGVTSLRKFLEGLEECYREEKKGRLVKAWEEEGRKFRVERRENGAGRYILCSVVDVETKRFCLVVPEGKGFLGGWAIFAEKLQDLGVVMQEEVKFEEAL